MEWIDKLRQHRHLLFDEAFQEELAGLYQKAERGHPPVAPAMLALALILEAYTGVSDDEVIEATMMDRRLIERTLEVASQCQAFGPWALRAALDSSPLWGAGRVEDTYNLVGHAALASLHSCCAEGSQNTVSPCLSVRYFEKVHLSR